MPSEASLANLKPYKPGQSGNPGGRRKRVLSDRYAELMEEVLPEELRKPLKLPVGSLWGDALALVSARTALKSNETGVLQRKEIADRLEGKCAQRFELSAPEGGWEVRVVFEAPVLRRSEGAKAIEPPIDVKELPPGEVEADDESGTDS